MDKNTREKFIEFVEEYVQEDRKDKFRKVLEERTKYVTVVIEDPVRSQNASAVVRTCDCFRLAARPTNRIPCHCLGGRARLTWFLLIRNFSAGCGSLLRPLRMSNFTAGGFPTRGRACASITWKVVLRDIDSGAGACKWHLFFAFHCCPNLWRLVSQDWLAPWDASKGTWPLISSDWWQYWTWSVFACQIGIASWRTVEIDILSLHISYHYK